MMKIFVHHHAVLFILVVTTTIDASRIFYLPLPKIHSSHESIPTDNVEQNTNHEKYILSSSAVKQEETEKREDLFDLEALLDEQAAATKRRISVNERSPEHWKLLNDENHEKPDGDEPWFVDGVTGRAERLQSNPALTAIERKSRRNDALFLMIVGTCCVVGVVGLVAAAIFWYKIQKKAEAAVDTEYPSYGVTGPNASGGKISPSATMSDRKLAQSAQMYHYQQQRQQMMAQEKAHLDAKPVHSDDSDDEAPGGGDYTVYECPGLAPTGEMEVRNPLFTEPDSSLGSSASSLNPATNNHYPQLSTTPPKEKSLP